MFKKYKYIQIKEDKIKLIKYAIKIKNKKKKNKKLQLNRKIIKILFSFLSLIIIFIFIFFFLISIIKEYNYKKSIDIITKYKNYNKYKFSYDQIGEMIFTHFKSISFNQLDEYYYETKRDLSNFNHIHILFAFDNNYYLLSSVSITSILKTANKNSYIHFHIIVTRGFQFETMKKLNSLKKKINNNTEFIFYNGQAETDFGEQIMKEFYGVGEYAKLLCSKLIDNKVDRIISLDAGDILVEKDLLELYNLPFEEYLIRGVEDPYSPCLTGWDPFFFKERYINAGVIFYNLKKWREMDIYSNLLTFFKSFNFKGKLPTPHQDILNCFLPSASIGFLPLKYNHIEYIDLEKSDDQKGAVIYNKNCSYFYNKKEIVFEAEKNVVIRHYNHHKIYKGNWNALMTKKWQNYAKMTGFYEDICKKYPLGCK